MDYIKKLNRIMSVDVIVEALTPDELKRGIQLALQVALKNHMLYKDKYPTFWIDEKGNPTQRLSPVPTGLTREYMDGLPNKVKANISNAIKLQKYIAQYSLHPDNVRKRILISLSRTKEGNEIIDNFGGGGEIATKIAASAQPQHEKMLSLMFNN